MKTKEYKEYLLSKILDNLDATRVDKIQRLIKRSYSYLKEQSRKYWSEYREMEKRGNTLEAKVMYKKYDIVRDAITVKKGNEEQAWDYLS